MYLKMNAARDLSASAIGWGGGEEVILTFSSACSWQLSMAFNCCSTAMLKTEFNSFVFGIVVTIILETTNYQIISLFEF